MIEQGIGSRRTESRRHGIEQGGPRKTKEDNMKRAVVIALAVVLSISGCGGDDDNEEESGIANPASVYCEEQGGTVDIRIDESGNQIGICVFSDESEVDEWAYFRGEAEPAVPGK